VVAERFRHHAAFGFAGELDGDGAGGDFDHGADALFEVDGSGFAGEDEGVGRDALDDAPGEDVLDFTRIGAIEEKHAYLLPRTCDAGRIDQAGRWARSLSGGRGERFALLSLSEQGFELSNTSKRFFFL
jgi:hypothetical protein